MKRLFHTFAKVPSHALMLLCSVGCARAVSVIPPASTEPATSRPPTAGQLSPSGGDVYRLAGRGRYGGPYKPVPDLGCCDPILAGWIVIRPHTWLAVDSVRVSRTDGAGQNPGTLPMTEIRVDSGPNLDFSGKAVFLGRVGPRVIPNSGATGEWRGDSLIIRAAEDYGSAMILTKVYLRVRP